MVRVIKAERLNSAPLKKAMVKKIERSIDNSWEILDDETETQLQEIEKLNLSYEHEIFRTRVSHTISIGDVSFTYANIIEIGLVTKG